MQNQSTVLILLNQELLGGALHTVRVSYDENVKNQHTIKKTFISDLKPGEFVTVQTGTRYNATVCKVVDVDVEVDFDSDTPIGWVFGRVDMAALEKLCAEEARILGVIRDAELKERREKLKAAVLSQLGGTLPQLEVSIPKE